METVLGARVKRGSKEIELGAGDGVRSRTKEMEQGGGVGSRRMEAELEARVRRWISLNCFNLRCCAIRSAPFHEVHWQLEQCAGGKKNL